MRAGPIFDSVIQAGLRIVASVLCLGAALPLSAQLMPPESRPRAERYAAWRSMLEDADDALAEGRWEQAEKTLLAVIEQARALDSPNLVLARAVDRLGDLRRELGRFDEAERLYRESAQLWQAVLGASQPRLAVTLHNLGVVYVQLQRYDDARSSLERALEIVERSIGTRSDIARNTLRVLKTIDELELRAGAGAAQESPADGPTGSR